MKKKSAKIRKTRKRQACHAGMHSDTDQLIASQPTNECSNQAKEHENEYCCRI